MKHMKVLGLCALLAVMMVSCGPGEPQPNNENKNWESLEIKMAELPQLCQSLIKQDTAKVLWQMSDAGFQTEYNRYGEIQMSRGALKMTFVAEEGMMIQCGFSIETSVDDSIIAHWRAWEEQAYSYSTWSEWEAMGVYFSTEGQPQQIDTPYRDEWLEFLEGARANESELMFEIMGAGKNKYYGFMRDINETTEEIRISYDLAEM